MQLYKRLAFKNSSKCGSHTGLVPPDNMTMLVKEARIYLPHDVQECISMVSIERRLMLDLPSALRPKH